MVYWKIQRHYQIVGAGPQRTKRISIHINIVGFQILKKISPLFQKPHLLKFLCISR